MSSRESESIDQLKSQNNFWEVSRFIVDRILALDLGGISSMMTLATLTGLVPLLALSLAVFAIFPAFSSLRTELDQLILQSFLPEAYAEVLLSYLKEFSQHAAGLTTFGLIGLGVTALLLINKLFDTINRIFQVKERRHFAQRLLVYWALLTVGPFAVALSIALTGQLAAMALSGIDSTLAGTLYKFGQLALQCLTFALIYKWIPNKPVRFLHALMGGFVVSLLYIVVKDVFAGYVANGSLTNIYGAFAALPVLVLWVHIGWYLLFAGATITALIPEITRCRKARHVAETGDAFDAALGILGSLLRLEAQGKAPVLKLESLSREVECTTRAWEEGLQALIETHYVSLGGEDSGTEIALISPSDRVTLEALHCRLLLDLSQPNIVRSGFAQHLTGSEALQTPIRTLFAS